MLHVYTLDTSEQWDQIVRSFKRYDTYYLSGYVKAFKIHGDGEPLLLYYESKNDPMRGINVVMKRDVSTAPRLEGKIEREQYYDLTTPYGYGGWLLEGGGKSNQIIRDYQRWCEAENIVAEFVRFHPMLGNQVFFEDSYTVIPLGETVAIDLSSPEAIWNNMSSINRNVIRKAVKNGVKIYSGRNPELFEKFRAIYNATMDRDDAEQYYYFGKEFYQSVLEDLPEQAQILYAQIPDGTVIGASIFLISNRYMNYHLSGSVREYSSLASTNLLLYKAAMYGNTIGCRTLYLGGGVGSGEDGLFKFKRAFYKKGLHRFYIGKKVINQEKYDEICDRADVVSHSHDIRFSDFFPEYRQ